MKNLFIGILLSALSLSSFASSDTFDKELCLKRSDTVIISGDSFWDIAHVEFNFEKDSNSFIMTSYLYVNNIIHFNDDGGYVYRHNWLYYTHETTPLKKSNIPYVRSLFYDITNYNHSLMILKSKNIDKELNTLLCAKFRVDNIIQKMSKNGII